MQLNFAHLCIRTRDLEQTERFYTQALGLEKVFSFYRNDRVIGFYLRISGTEFIEVFEAEDVENVPSTIAHLCLQTDDLDQARKELEEHGISSTEKSLGCDNSYQIWFKDPNGMDIELHQYTDASAQLTGKDINVNW